MRIRNKITLWIVGAGLLAGFLFSIVITYELIEQPYELMDEELDSQAHTLLVGLAPQEGRPASVSDKVTLRALGKLYWFKVYNYQRELIYASVMTEAVDLPLRQNDKAYNISASVPAGATMIEADDDDNVTFRVRLFTIPFSGQKYLVQIARPMEKLQDEINDLIISVTVGLVTFAITLIILSYFVAGKILQPIATINKLASDISDKTLDKRIPLGRNHDELFDLSSSLNRMFDRLQFSFQHQKEFIANASHELKTPIAIQRLFFEESLQRTDLPDDFQKHLNDQTKILYRTDRLIKNLLDLSRLELKKSLELSTVDLSRLAASVLRDFDEITRSNAIEIKADIQDGVYLQADKDQLRQVFINLLDNASKYSSGDKQEIQFSLRTEKDHVSIMVYNTGQGIPTADLTRVFSQFYRVEQSRSTTFGGSGLGLTIVKRIVELHHGTVKIESEYGSWVRVNIILPK